jgi:hypothetical protein
MMDEPYHHDVARSRPPAARSIDEAVHDALASLLPRNLGGQPHLTRAVIADRIAAAATRLSRAEVMAARDRDGATWDDVADAFGVTRQAAHERFRTGPDGLHSRYFKRQPR